MTLSPELEIGDPSIDLAMQTEMLERAMEHPLELSSEAFEHDEHTCTCIDEGTPGDFRLAGAGILDPEGFDHAVATLREAGVTKVTSHAECGAVAIAARKEFGPSVSQGQIDAFGQDWARRVAEALDVAYDHIDELDRPDDEHDAAIICVDLVGGLRTDRIPDDMPKSFTISGLHTAPSHVAEQVRVAVDIMLGDHGKYQDLFSAEQPINVVLVGGEEASPARHDLVEEIHAAVQDLGTLVKIEHLGVRE